VFACSAAYHLARDGALKALLRRFDHAAIYFKIAGTYTPFAAIKMADAAGLALLAGVWAVTAFGATAKLLWPGRLVRTSYVLYLAQGWAIVAALGPFASAVSGRVLALLLAGGLIYTVGVVFHLWERLPYHNAVWHGLVLAASACHFAAIVDAVGLAGGA
jgi:hemolysin III